MTPLVASDEGLQEITQILDAVRMEVRANTLRSVARDIGMSPTGLQGVLDGASPYGRTRERLKGWYLRTYGMAGFSVGGSRDLLFGLLRALPEPDHGAPLVLDAVEEAHRRASVPIPGWVQALRLALPLETAAAASAR